MPAEPATPPPKSRVVRVFVSSTFRDLQDERDRLVKFAFPELRLRCRQRQVEFVEALHISETVANPDLVEHLE